MVLIFKHDIIGVLFILYILLILYLCGIIDLLCLQVILDKFVIHNIYVADIRYHIGFCDKMPAKCIMQYNMNGP